MDWRAAAKGTASWTSSPFVLEMAGAALLIAAFVLRQRVATDPLIPKVVFKSRNRVTAAVVSILVAVFVTGMIRVRLFP